MVTPSIGTDAHLYNSLANELVDGVAGDLLEKVLRNIRRSAMMDQRHASHTWYCQRMMPPAVITAKKSSIRSCRASERLSERVASDRVTLKERGVFC